MSDTTASLRRKISSAGDLQSVVRTMKALAASSIGQYEKSVRALADYYRTVELGLGACFRESEPSGPDRQNGKDKPMRVRLARSCSVPTRDWWASSMMWWPIMRSRPSRLCPGNPKSGPSVSAFMRAWRTRACRSSGLFTVPNSVKAITPLVGQIQIESEAHRAKGEYARLYVFHNRPQSGALYEPVSQRLLPLDAQWQQGLAKVRWPTKNLPEVMGGGTATLRALIREYLFISLFRACAESLASENASRLAAMERADKNIDELLENLHGTFHRLRQSASRPCTNHLHIGRRSFGREVAGRKPRCGRKETSL